LKQAICDSFSRAAHSYDSWASVQREVAHLLLAELPAMPSSRSPLHILEIGCGTGCYTALLMEHLKHSLGSREYRLTALDISFDMIKQAQNSLRSSFQALSQAVHAPLAPTNISFLCADGEELPFSCAKTRFGLITSNSTFQWFQTPERSIRAAYDLLAGHGILHFSFFGPQSLKELQTALHEAGFDAQHIAATGFLSRERLYSILCSISPSVRMKEVMITRRYDNLLHLLKTLKLTGVSANTRAFERADQGLGAYKPRPGHRDILRMSSQGLKRIEQAYLKHHKAICASYQVFICTLFKE
jgi:malonyl-CoA O-methyltransferase